MLDVDDNISVNPNTFSFKLSLQKESTAISFSALIFIDRKRKTDLELSWIIRKKGYKCNIHVW